MKIEPQRKSTTTIVIEEGDCLMITTPEDDGKTCIYMDCVCVQGFPRGKLQISGGADIISAIVGEGMKDKIR